MRLAARPTAITTLPAMFVGLGFAVMAQAAETTIRQWEFNQPGGLEGWHAGGHLRQTRVAGGVLETTVTDWDPILFHDVFEEPLAATATQVVDIRLDAPGEGTAELFWTNTTEGKYGGFAPEKRTPLPIQPGWHVYRFRPFWQGEGKIIKIRLDLPGIQKGHDPERTYRIDYLRILEPDRPTPPATADWDFDDGLQGWSVEGEGSAIAEAGWLAASLPPHARLVAPPVRVDARRHVFVSFVAAVQEKDPHGIRSGRLVWASEERSGVGTLDFPLQADGQPHVYNLPVSVHEGWHGTVVYLGLETGDDPPCPLRVDWLRTGAEPSGPAEIEVRRFLLADPLPRAGRPAELLLQLANRGGRVEAPVHAQLLLPDGVRLVRPADAPRRQREPLIHRLDELDFYQPQQRSWYVVSDNPGSKRFRVQLDGPAKTTAETTDTFLPAVDVPRASYVPEPQPVRGDFDVGVYYFPGWATWDRWQRIVPFPERQPVLGWYREGLPEVADWHIKWAVEHGITFFCYDWYWHQGQTRLDHALHDGFLQARYRHMLQFCLLWANHAPTRHSQEDNRAVCQYWIDHYFKRPEYFQVDGRPLLVIFSVWAMKRDLGIDGSRKAIERWHQMTRDAGVGQIMVAGCGRGGQTLDEMRQMGFDAVTGYNWPQCGVEGRNFVPYIEVARNQLSRWWMPMADPPQMPVLVPASPGWDSRPWHGRQAFVQVERTPEAFEEHLRLARQFAEKTGQPRVVLMEAWNEFGEGSYCEPHKEFGFRHLDAVRRVFCPKAPAHGDIGPADVGLGPYDVVAPDRTHHTWEFSDDGDAGGWTPMMGLADMEVAGGLLHARTTTRDPAFSCPVRLRARRYATLELRMAVSGTQPGDRGQLFWATTFTATREPASIRFELAPGGAMHTYRLDVGAHALWRGTITQLRLDPCSTPNARVTIDCIRLQPDAGR